LQVAEVIEAHFGNGSAFNCEIAYLRESRALGTGGALALLPEVPRAPLLVLNGDQITQANLSALLAFHEAENADASIAVRPYQVEIPYGVVIHDGSKLLEIHEKPTANYIINSGIYVLDPRVLPLVPRNEEFPITALFGLLLKQKRRVSVYYFDEDWIDIGRPDELRKARGQ